MNCFVWDVTLRNATRQQLLDWRKEHARAPKPGTVNVHNENEEWKEVSPTFQRAEFEVQEKTLKSQILATVGMPTHWFGEQIVARATATEQNVPAIKRLQSRQLYVRYIIGHIMRFVVDQGILKGKLNSPGIGKVHKLEITAPEISNKDLNASATSMMNVVQAITIALTANIIDLLSAQRIFVDVARELGADISLDEMLKRMGPNIKANVPAADGSVNKMSPTRDTPGQPVSANDRQPGANNDQPVRIRAGADQLYPTNIREALATLRVWGVEFNNPGPGEIAVIERDNLGENSGNDE